MEPIRVVLVEDHTLARVTMGYFLENAGDMKVVGEAGDGTEAVDLARMHKPDVVLMDYFMPGMDGAQATRQILEYMPETRVVGMSHNDSHAVQEALLGAGAVAFMTKRSSMDDLVGAIRKAAGR